MHMSLPPPLPPVCDSCLSVLTLSQYIAITVIRYWIWHIPLFLDITVTMVGMCLFA